MRVITSASQCKDWGKQHFQTAHPRSTAQQHSSVDPPLALHSPQAHACASPDQGAAGAVQTPGIEHGWHLQALLKITCLLHSEMMAF